MKNIILSFLILFTSCNTIESESQSKMDSSYHYIWAMDDIYQYETKFKTGSSIINSDSVQLLYDSLKKINPDSGLVVSKNFLNYVKGVLYRSKHLSDSFKVIKDHIDDSIRISSYKKWLKTPPGKLHRLHPNWTQSMCDEEYKRIQSEKKWWKSKAGRIQKKHPNWSRGDCEGLANNQIWIGMHIDMVKYLRGLPNHVNTSNYGNGNSYQMCWDDYNPSCFYCEYDGIVTSYN